MQTVRGIRVPFLAIPGTVASLYKPRLALKRLQFSRHWTPKQAVSRSLRISASAADSPRNSSFYSNKLINYALGQGIYTAVGVIYTAATCAIISASPFMTEKVFGVCALPQIDLLYRNVGALMFGMITLCFCTQLLSGRESAVESSLYKRMTLVATVSFAATWFLTLYHLQMGVTMTKFGALVQTIVQLLPLLAYFKIFGVKELPKALAGVMSGVKSVFRPTGVRSAIYALFSVSMFIYSIATLACPTTTASLILAQSTDRLGTFLLRLTGLLMGILGVVCFTLKEGADEGRLGEITFKALNVGAFVTSISKIGVTIYLCKIAPFASNTSLLTPLALITMATHFGPLALFSAYNAIRAKD